MDKQDEIKKFLIEEKVQVCAILETHLKPKGINQAGNNVFHNWKWESNSMYSPNSCRIMVGWNSNLVHLMILQVTRQVIFCLIETVDNKVKMYCSFVYASNNGRERQKLWSDLSAQAIITKGHSWIILGDFNVTRNINEHSAGGSQNTDEINEFNDLVNNIEVEDLGSTGCYFTWIKSLKNPNCGILKKLDRILCNEECITCYPQAYGTFLPFMVSDHSPAIFTIPQGISKKKKSFRFMNHVAEMDNFYQVVKKGWNVNVPGHKMFQVVKKLKGLKKELNHLNWSNGNMFTKVKDLRVKLKSYQAKVVQTPHDSVVKAEATAILMEYERAKHEELGIRYFGDQVPDQFVKHFQDFLGKSSSCTPIASLGDIFSKKLSNEEALAMESPVTDEEIKAAMFDIDVNKASGRDGYSSMFFKKAWGIIGKYICDAIKEFFSTGQLLGEVNATLIALIPKVEVPNKVSEFRPIACCNIIYKCISKVLTNRVKSVLDKLVGCNQSAFIP
ncbi:uncharacterized protein [Rutidosis leptorrhynchoides]|uniref:uncharacterized protein n=1 Tax=Rutidosis leptorrhynchoides TaxID=125765 RepID=UPI003A998F16